jgi:hypothetical protein
MTATRISTAHARLSTVESARPSEASDGGGARRTVYLDRPSGVDRDVSGRQEVDRRVESRVPVEAQRAGYRDGGEVKNTIVWNVEGHRPGIHGKRTQCPGAPAAEWHLRPSEWRAQQEHEADEGAPEGMDQSHGSFSWTVMDAGP